MDDKIIKDYVDQFEELYNNSNMDLMRDFIKSFVAKIELWGRKEGKRRGRKIHIHGQIPALTMIGVASPIVQLSNPLIEDLKKLFDLEPVLPVEYVDWNKNWIGITAK